MATTAAQAASPLPALGLGVGVGVGAGAGAGVGVGAGVEPFAVFPGAISDCCPPLARAPLSAAAADQLATLLKAIAVPARLRLLSMIYVRDGGEACVCELTEPLGLTQPTVSHHLKVLVEAGLITREKRGVWAYYRPVPGAMAALAAMLTPTPATAEPA